MKNKQLFRDFAKYSSLNVLGMIGLSCYILADTFFVSKGLGTSGLAALTLAIPIYSFIHGIGLMLGMGGATKYAITTSQGKRNDANKFFTNTTMMGAICALIFVLVGIFLSKQITGLLGADASVFEMTDTYLKVLLLFSPAFIFNDILICFVRNDGNPKLSMLGMLGGSLSNILLDYIFIFPMNMDIFGAVFATGLAPIISIAILSPHLIKKDERFRLVKTKPSFAITKFILALGFPSLITEVASGLVIIVFNVIILNLQGNVGVAAYGIVANLSLVLVAIYTGMAQGVQPLISNAHGVDASHEGRTLFRYSIVAMVLLSCVTYALTFFGADWIAQIFNSESSQQLQDIATYGLKLYFTALPFVGFNIIVSVFFTSTESPLPAHLVSLLRGLVIIIPVAFLLSTLWGLTGVWLSFPVTEILVSFVGFFIYIKLSKKQLEKE